MQWSVLKRWVQTYGHWLAVIVLFYLPSLWVVLCGFTYFYTGMHEHAFTPDLPWILQAGEWMIRRHALPTIDLFSWTHAGRPVGLISMAV